MGVRSVAEACLSWRLSGRLALPDIDCRTHSDKPRVCLIRHLPLRWPVRAEGTKSQGRKEINGGQDTVQRLPGSLSGRKASLPTYVHLLRK